MRLTLVYSPIPVVACTICTIPPSASFRQSPDAKQTAATPEMDRLATALAGDWETVETMECSRFFPNGGSRHGVVHAWLASGGDVLIYEVHSDGSAGKLDGFHTIWWDEGKKLYYFFACFNGASPCSMRGTAHREGSTFVNDYVETVDGKNTRWRDTFAINATAHIPTVAIETGHGCWKTVITTKAARR
jgi:hypothetical protein